MDITSWSFKYHQFVFVSVALLFIAGIISYFNIARNENPGFIIRMAQVITYMPGASPQRIEELVTDKIEKHIEELPEIEYITSQSRPGVSIIYVKVLDRYTDIPSIWEKLRRKVDNAERELPESASKPIVNDEYGDVFGIILGITWDGFTYAEVKEIADDVRNQLLQLRDVAKVEIIGEQEERIYIEYHTSKLAEIGISPGILKQTLTETNIISPGGVINSETKQIPVEPTGNFDSVDAIKNTLISIPGTNNLLKLSDIAEVKREYIEPRQSLMHTSSKPSLGLAIVMREGGNIVSLGDQVRQLLEDIERALPLGIYFDYLLMHPEIVTEKISNFVRSLTLAVIIVCVVMLLFLGIRTGLVVASLIPMTIIISLLAMFVFEIGLDQVSLASLMIAVGMLVDNAIVMSESILVQMELGRNARRAAINAANELKLSLLVSSLTTAVAFIPIYLAESSTGEYTRSIFVVVTITLLISWILSITIIPLLCVYFLKVKKRSQKEMDDSVANQRYRGFLIFLLKNRWKSILSLSLVFLLAILSFRFIPKLFFPQSDIPILKIEIELPFGVSLQRTESTVTQIENFIIDHLSVNKNRSEGVLSWASYIGRASPRFRLQYRPEAPSANYAMTLLNLSSVAQIPWVTVQIESFIFEHFPDVKAKIKPLQEGAPVKDAIEVRISGKDPQILLQLADRVRDRLEDIPGTKNVLDDWGEKIPKIIVNIDPQLAKNAKVTHVDVAKSLKGALSGNQVTEYREGDKLIPIIVRSVAAHSPETLTSETYDIYSSVTGKSVPLNQIGNTEMEWEYGQIYRRNLKKTVTVSGQVEEGFNARAICAELEPWLLVESATWPPGYSWEFGGEVYESQKANDSIAEKLYIAVIAIVMLLMLQFNCIRNTLIVLLTIPMSIIGVAFGLLVMGSYFGFMTLLGVVSLTGIVINDAIVLLERIRYEYEIENQGWHDAVIMASQRRLRPILLTTITTVCGMIPLWYSGGAMWEPMVIAIVFGLTAATILTLGAVPVLYSLFFGLKFENYIWTGAKPYKEDLNAEEIEDAIRKLISQSNRFQTFHHR
ncbi:MAG: efflux RND transporter permease subunit [Chlamydiales bacterium]